MKRSDWGSRRMHEKNTTRRVEYHQKENTHHEHLWKENGMEIDARYFT
jgi:hypothetical protein